MIQRSGQVIPYPYKEAQILLLTSQSKTNLAVSINNPGQPLGDLMICFWKQFQRGTTSIEAADAEGWVVFR